MSKNITQKLQEIQTELKAPKNQRNNFGNYNYRNCEDILEALKPLLEKTKTALIITDEPIIVGDRFYIKATATLKDCESETELKATAYAREPLSKKGADEAQVTGSTSSYARKFCLNGLFCIDDTKDADATNTHGKEQGASQVVRATTQQIGEICELIAKTNTDTDNFLAFFKVGSMNELSAEQANHALNILKKKLKG